MTRSNKVYKNYFGSKNGSGVYQQIINHIRPHTIYMELFAGSGAIAQFKNPASSLNLINDIDVKVYEKWLGSAIQMPGISFTNHDAIDLLSNYIFLPGEQYCIYLDPPYPLDSRRSNREVYNHEMTDNNHRDLLKVVLTICRTYPNVDFLISTYRNEIYETMLSGWKLHRFEAQTRQGTATENLYMNYRNESGILHQYNFLGIDYIDRQRIKRKIEREITKLKNLPASERNAIITAVLDLA